MKLSLRSYPHPVVGNRDDVPGAAFQATIEMSADKENAYINVSIACSSTTVNRLIAQRSAQFVLHVECSNTLFRQAYEFSETSRRITISAENLNDAVEANVFCRAIRDISGYEVEKAHPDYGNSKFEIRSGDILAVAEGRVFHIESNFDSLSRIGSIMQIEEANESGDIPMRVEFNGDKIMIILSKQDFRDFKLLKNHDGLSAPLTCTIVLPVLVEALHYLRDGKDDPDEDDPRWMRVLHRRIEVMGFSSEMDNLVLAQKLLELPIKRSLASSRQLADDGA